jgi:hypothetical protein
MALMNQWEIKVNHLDPKSITFVSRDGVDFGPHPVGGFYRLEILNARETIQDIDK